MEKIKNVPFSEDDRVDNPVSIYAASKRACELLAYSYYYLFGLNTTCLRFFTVYGGWGRPDMALFKFTKNILEDKKIDVYNNGDMRRDFTYFRDIVEGFVKDLEKPLGFSIINLGHGSPAHLMNFIKIIEKELGKKAKINFMPMQPGDVKETYADTKKAKEFVRKNEEFTVNIALVKNNKPVFGVVYVPVKDVFFYTEKRKAFKQIQDNGLVEIYNNEDIKKKRKINIVASKSHFNQETQKYIGSLEKEYELVRKGSSLKLCAVAEGIADIYPRLGQLWNGTLQHLMLLSKLPEKMFISLTALKKN